jgi:hypothetical protein
MAQQIYLADSFPSYLSFLFDFNFSWQSFLPALIALTIIYIAGRLYLKYLEIQNSRKVKYSFLEIKPTDRTLKTALSTNQLFTGIHSIIKAKSSGWFLTTKKSISFEIVSTKNEGIRFILRVPKEDEGIIYKNLLAYLPGIEINIINDYLLSDHSLKTQELRLKNSYLYPLQNQELLSQFDPIAYITAHMTKLSDDELVAAQFICTPINEATHPKISNFLKEVETRLLNNLDISDLIKKTSSSFFGRIFEGAILTFTNLLVFTALAPIYSFAWIATNSKEPLPWWVFEKSRRRSIHELGMQKQTQYQSIHSKVSQPLFETTIRYFAASPNQRGSDQRLKGMFSAFETLNTSYQKVKAKNMAFSVIKHKLVNRLHNILINERISFFGSISILSVSELASFYHLPYTATTKTEDLLQVKSPQLPAPLALKQSETKLDITFANNNYGGIITPIGQTLEQRRRHTYIIGATGTGKSNFLLQMIYQDILNGKGVAVLDPHGELVETILGLIPKKRRKDVIYFNPYDVEHAIGLNLLKLPKGLTKVELDREKSLIVSTLISIFHKLYPERYSGPRMEHLLRNVVLTALATPDPTLSTIYKLLTDNKFRKPIVDALTDDHLKLFWKKEFGGLGSYQKADQIMPITNKLGTFLTTIITKSILDNPESNLDLSEVMNGKKILLCNLSKGKIGEDNSYFLGSLLMAEIQRAALRRISIKENERQDFFLYIDEFQNFATTSFAGVLSEARKYRLAAILAHQNTVQIDRDLLDTIIGNSGTMISFRTNSPVDEEKLLPLYSSKVEKGQMQNLPSYNFYIKISALVPQDVFTGEVEKFNVMPDEKVTAEVIKLSQDQYGKKPEPEIREVFVEKEKTPKKQPANPYKRQN